MHRNQFWMTQQKLIVFDDFNRADNATSMGNAVTGQAWLPTSGNFGIDSNQAYCSRASGSAFCVVDSGASDCVITIEVPIVYKNSTSSTRIVFRATDANNIMWLASRSAISYNWGIVMINGGVATTPYALDCVANNDDVVKITLNGSSVRISVNGTEYLNETITFNATATKHGIGSASSYLSRYDNFSVEAL